jgi:phytoene synthase
MAAHEQGEARNAAVQEAARSFDFDRYLAALLAPDKPRAGLMAVAAYHGEIARIPLSVTEPMIAEIRLQWWRDALIEPRDTPTGNPVADAVRAAMAAYALPAHTLLEIIDGYERILQPDTLAGASALEAFCTSTQGAVFRLSARIMLGEAGPQPVLAAAGQCYGRIQLLRALPLLAAHGRPPWRDGETAAMLPALLEQCSAELARARQLVTSAPKSILPALLPLALVEPYLKALQSLGLRAADERADISALGRAWRLLKASALRRF